MASQTRFVCVTPQFTRPKGRPAPLAPPDDWSDLQAYNPATLIDMGLRMWNDPDCPDSDWPHKGKILWLLPGEWYAYIPDGTEFYDIFGEPIVFSSGETDDDIRFGCLSFGVLRDKLVVQA